VSFSSNIKTTMEINYLLILPILYCDITDRTNAVLLSFIKKLCDVLQREQMNKLYKISFKIEVTTIELSFKN